MVFGLPSKYSVRSAPLSVRP